ncbi:MAG: hypothetical protein GY714_21995 [Desulfobacterales bacterium]|nr:hypothetical protein [Desulfobacterales bacterium]MCP4158800.1 hypothetical protein [Deltaproteobacteria bacterium]
MRPLKFFITFLLILSIPAVCFSNDLVENVGEGQINWTKKIARAKGIGAPSRSQMGLPSARPLAIRAAKLDAYRNLLEAVKGIRVDATTVITNYTTSNDIVMTKVDGMVKGAKVIKLEYMSDGTVEVTVEIDLNKGFAQLVLPQDIKQVETIKPMVDNSIQSEGVFSGLIVDARGLSVRPAMAPKIIDENQKEVYGSAFVSREFAVQQGMCGYVKNVTAAKSNKRVKGNALLVKGIKSMGPGKSNIVISNADAARLRSSSKHLSFMRECRVIIIVD